MSPFGCNLLKSSQAIRPVGYPLFTSVCLIVKVNGSYLMQMVVVNNICLYVPLVTALPGNGKTNISVK